MSDQRQVIYKYSSPNLELWKASNASQGFCGVIEQKAPRVTLDCVYPLLQSQIQIIAEVCKESGEKYLERQVAGADERQERTG